MDLTPFLKNLSDQSDEVLAAFAERCETSIGHLRNIGYGYRPCAPALAVRIELESGHEIRRWDLRPNDWHLIWPELKDADGAPEVTDKPAVEHANKAA